MTVDRYTDNLTIKLSSGKTLTLDADTLVVTGSASFSNLGNTTVNGTLTVSGVTTLNGVLAPEGDITKTSSLSITASGGSSNVIVNTGLNFVVNATGDTDFNVTSDFDVNAGDAITMSAAAGFTVTADSTLQLNGGNSGTGGTMTLNSAGVAFSAEQSSAYIADFLNSSTSASADVMLVRTLAASPDSTTRYMTFASGVGLDTRGVIRGAQTNTAAAFYTEGTSGDRSAYGSTPDLVEVNTAGDVVFVSGSADYGEFVECGDLSEWPVEIEEGEKYLGIPEGYIVFVREQAFYKSGQGTPMIVSHRSIIVGNEKDSDGKVGQVLSFIGQVPVYVEGKVSSGDLIIPMDDYYGRAVSPVDVTFEDYKRAIGTAWESSDKEELKRVMCSVGIKNTR